MDDDETTDFQLEAFNETDVINDHPDSPDEVDRTAFSSLAETEEDPVYDAELTDPEEEESKPEEILSLYEDFKAKNGKAPPVILFQLLSRIFDEDMTRVENFFKGYLDAIIAKKIFKAQDFGEGISKVV